MIIVQQVSFCSACTLNICQIPLLDKVLQISKIQLKNCVSVKFGESCIHADVKGNVYLYLYFSTRFFLAKLWSHSYHSSAVYKIRVMKTDEIFFEVPRGEGSPPVPLRIRIQVPTEPGKDVSSFGLKSALSTSRKDLHYFFDFFKKCITRS